MLAAVIERVVLPAAIVPTGNVAAAAHLGVHEVLFATNASVQHKRHYFEHGERLRCALVREEDHAVGFHKEERFFGEEQSLHLGAEQNVSGIEYRGAYCLHVGLT